MAVEGAHYLDNIRDVIPTEVVPLTIISNGQERPIPHVYCVSTLSEGIKNSELVAGKFSFDNEGHLHAPDEESVEVASTDEESIEVASTYERIIQEGRDLIVTTCGHIFSERTLEGWIHPVNPLNPNLRLTNTSCPNCRHHVYTPDVPVFINPADENNMPAMSTYEKVIIAFNSAISWIKEQCHEIYVGLLYFLSDFSNLIFIIQFVTLGIAIVLGFVGYQLLADCLMFGVLLVFLGQLIILLVNDAFDGDRVLIFMQIMRGLILLLQIGLNIYTIIKV